MADAIPPAATLPASAPAPAGFDAATALKNAALAALVALGLSIPILALRTEQGPGTDLILLPRWGLVAIICAIVFAGHFLLGLAGFHLPAARRARSRKDAIRTVTPEEAARQGGWRHWLGVAAVPLFLGVALTFPVIAWLTSGGLSESRYWVDLATLILTYVMLGWGLNIVVGLAGLLDLGYVAFYAVGAYSYALLSTSAPIQAWMEAHVGADFWPLWAFWFCLPVSGILAAFWGILLGFPVLRLRGDYLAIVTLAFGEIIRLVLINWVEVTNGGAGISGIPRATFFGIPFTANENGFAARFGIEYDPMHRLIFLYYLILVLALLTNWVTLRVRRLPLGRAWEALREDEIACRALGINTRNTKLTAFAMGAMFGGFAGAFFAVRQAFVSPESFNFLESATILAIVVLGGMGSQIGVAIAAIAVVAGPELLRNLGFLQAIFGAGFDPNEYRLLLFGLAMVGMMIWRPRGLISQRNPSAMLKERKAVAGSFVGEGRG